ncbi:MAG: DNA-binding protein [Alphaproteobacteria bacterium]|nr:MAG: DNA-binding protein [Alphaproteobacteria bacterium]
MSEGMHPEDIKAAIRKRGTTMKELSLGWGFSESAISKSLTDPMPYVEPKTAKFIGKKLYQIWPDRYDRENIRIRPNKIKSKAKKCRSHCKKLPAQFTSTKNGEKS